jgi:hypothetical protein
MLLDKINSTIRDVTPKANDPDSVSYLEQLEHVKKELTEIHEARALSVLCEFC